MFELFSEMWNFAFMQPTFVATTVLSASVAPVGAFLVLRRLSLAAEAMAHAVTPGFVIGFARALLSVTSLPIGGFVAGVVAAALTALLAEKTILRSNASLASIYLIALVAGWAVPLKSFPFWLYPRHRRRLNGPRG